MKKFFVRLFRMLGFIVVRSANHGTVTDYLQFSWDGTLSVVTFDSMEQFVIPLRVNISQLLQMPPGYNGVLVDTRSVSRSSGYPDQITIEYEIFPKKAHSITVNRRDLEKAD